MTTKEALSILGLSGMATLDILKRRYHHLMLIAHPDAREDHGYPHDAIAINLAYEYLTKNWKYTEHTSRKAENPKARAARWNAPVNAYAYAPRNIYHTVEDVDGRHVGAANIDRGRFLWTEDEDFSLFLKSLYDCAREIVREYDGGVIRSQETDMSLLAKLTYLLAEQFIDTGMVLKLLAKPMEDESVYQIDAMLELELATRERPKEGDILYPTRMTNHRLYVKGKNDKEAGYISFKDDRLYYGIIPLLERRAAKVKMSVKGNDLKYYNRRRYADVDMLIKIEQEDKTYMIENINLKIDQLLRNQAELER